MKSNLFLLCTLLVSAGFTTACSTIDRGLTDHLRIDTVPQGATVTVFSDDHIEQRTGKATPPKVCPATPCGIALYRRTDGVARIEKAGHETVDLYFRPSSSRSSFAGSVALNPSISTASGLGLGAFSAGFGEAITLGLTTSQSATIIRSATQAGLYTGIAFTATDMVTGANLNLSPNPIVIGLSPEATPTQTDAMAALYLARREAKIKHEKACLIRRTGARKMGDDKQRCEELKAAYLAADQAFSEGLKVRKGAEKALRAKLRQMHRDNAAFEKETRPPVESASE